MSKILAHLVESPWAIQREAFETIVAVATRELDDPSFAKAVHMDPGEAPERTSYLRVRDNVALLEVSGPLFRYANLFTEVSGATSTEILARDLGVALEDDSVREIILQINSPGGEVSGIDEMGELVRAATERKRVTAHVSGMGASGAYWLAAAADEVVATPASILGSIGAVLSLRDYSSRDEKRGVRTYDFVSSVSPNKRLDPATENGRDQIQKMVDDLGEVFVSTVARYRGVSREHVLGHFGQGAVFVGETAVEAGLADRIATLETVIAETSQRTSPLGNRNQPRMGRLTTGGRTMSDLQITAAWISEEHPEVADELRAGAHAKGLEEGRAEAAEKVEAAVEAERGRIAGIQALHAPGLDKLRAELVAEGVSVEAASRRILDALAERARARGDAFIEGRESHEAQADAPGPSTSPEVQGREEKAQRILHAGRARQTA